MTDDGKNKQTPKEFLVVLPTGREYTVEGLWVDDGKDTIVIRGFDGVVKASVLKANAAVVMLKEAKTDGPGLSVVSSADFDDPAANNF